MVKIITTSALSPNLGETEKLHVYNGLDCCVTLEVFNVIEPQLDNTTRGTYEFSKALQAPILEMNMRGVLVDQAERSRLLVAYRADLDRLEAAFNLIIESVFEISTKTKGKAKWWRSNANILHLFYTVMQIPQVRKRNPKGEMVPTVNREALEKISGYFNAEPLVRYLLAMRDIGKKIGVLETAIDPDSRIRTTYNIAGTTTGRLSSSLSDFGTGTNLQNIEQRLRRIFIADPGYKFANIDLSQADARGVAGILWNLFRDRSYLDACESGDLHTYVCRLAWQDLPWTGDLKRDRDIADRPAYRWLSFRDLAKRLGHGTNFMGAPPTMAKHTKMPTSVIAEFQHKRYFPAFPNIPNWHNHVRQEIWTNGYLTTMLGRKRWFLGRRDDDSTIREAVAYEPQSITADVIDRGLLTIWRRNYATLLLQVHDSVLCQYPEELEHEILPKLLESIERPIPLEEGLTLTIPAEAKVGWNWSDFNYKDPDANPDGLKKYDGSDTRRRRNNPSTSLLDRRF